ncbi:MAG: replicative DNA helicase [Clostridiales Family XIII bacterium]|jgi:replicative DNA helicase|nr:replicative DNA helicase [Clostridiales Family XIII bacterium]
MPEKPRPHNADAEQSVLGAALQNAYAADEAAETLGENDFFSRENAEAFAAIKELVDTGKPVDLITVAETLKRRGMLEAVGGNRYLAELVSAVPAPSNIRHYADIVREHSTRRRLIECSESIIEKAHTGEDEALAVLDYAEREILEIGRSGQKEDYYALGDVVKGNIARMEELSKLKAGELTGLTTGFKDIDKLTLGLQPSDLIILAARPGMGKTSLALNIALNAALKAQAVVMVFSLEMSRASLGQRLLSSHAEIDSMLIRSGRAVRDKNKAAKLGEAADELGKAKIVIDDTSAIQISEIKNKCRRLKAKESRLDLVVVDYLQLMDFGGSGKASARPENRQQEIATLSRMLKQLARDIDCPVLVLSQLSRAVEQRGGHRPVLADLRESGAIEQDADIVMFIYQDEDRGDGDGPDVNLTRQLSIAKHRNGETAVLTLRWLGAFTKFGNYDASADWLVNMDAPPPAAGAEEEDEFPL